MVVHPFFRLLPGPPREGARGRHPFSSHRHASIQRRASAPLTPQGSFRPSSRHLPSKRSMPPFWAGPPARGRAASPPRHKPRPPGRRPATEDSPAGLPVPPAYGLSHTPNRRIHPSRPTCPTPAVQNRQPPKLAAHGQSVPAGRPGPQRTRPRRRDPRLPFAPAHAPAAPPHAHATPSLRVSCGVSHHRDHFSETQSFSRARRRWASPPPGIAARDNAGLAH